MGDQILSLTRNIIHDAFLILTYYYQCVGLVEWEGPEGRKLGSKDFKTFSPGLSFSVVLGCSLSNYTKYFAFVVLCVLIF